MTAKKFTVGQIESIFGAKKTVSSEKLGLLKFNYHGKIRLVRPEQLKSGFIGGWVMNEAVHSSPLNTWNGKNGKPYKIFLGWKMSDVEIVEDTYQQV